MKNQGDALIDAVLNDDGMTPHERILLVALARRMDWKTGKVRMLRETLAARTGLSDWQLRQAINGVVGRGLVERKRTGRSAIFKFSPSLNKEIERVEVMPTTHQKGGGPRFAPEPDPDCIPEYEAAKLDRERLWPYREGVPGAEGMDAMGEMTRCLYVEAVYAGKIIPFPFVRREHLKQPEAMSVLGPDPEDLSEDQWAMHKQRANEFLGVG